MMHTIYLFQSHEVSNLLEEVVFSLTKGDVKSVPAGHVNGISVRQWESEENGNLPDYKPDYDTNVSSAMELLSGIFMYGVGYEISNIETHDKEKEIRTQSFQVKIFDPIGGPATETFESTGDNLAETICRAWLKWDENKGWSI